MSDFAQTVKQQADIVKIVESYIRLRKSGAQNYSGLCPFHKEKSPSFSVHATRQFFHCFGCGVSGDVFTFVGKIENVTFPEAVRIVAQKCGIPLPKREYSSPEQAAEARMRGRLLDLHEAATAWFEEQLAGPEGAVAREYLAGRGLTPEGIKKFRIGYAPDSFNGLRDRLSPLADAETLRASGLFSQKQHEDGTLGPIYDRFRKRITFPIANESGRIIAFTARTIETGDKAGPKYMNSPETPLYTKSLVLFNLDKAKTAIRQLEFALLVEGQMDCISVYLRGIQNVIATSGTAFTEHQAAILKRHTSNVVISFDPDTAGANATEKTIGLLAEEGFRVKIVNRTFRDSGMDPDRFVREMGAEEFRRAVNGNTRERNDGKGRSAKELIEAIRGAQWYADYFIERALTLFPGHGSDQKVKAMNFLLPHIRRMPDLIAREDFAKNAAFALKIEESMLREELRQAALRRHDHIEVRSSTLNEVEKVLLRALAITDPEHEDSRSSAIKAIHERSSLFEQLSTFPAMQLLARRESKDPMDVIEDSAQRSLLAEALMSEPVPPTDDEVLSSISAYEKRQINRELETIRIEMAEAGKRDWTEALKYAERKIQLDKRLAELNKMATRNSAKA